MLLMETSTRQFSYAVPSLTRGEHAALWYESCYRVVSETSRRVAAWKLRHMTLASASILRTGPLRRQQAVGKTQAKQSNKAIARTLDGRRIKQAEYRNGGQVVRASSTGRGGHPSKKLTYLHDKASVQTPNNTCLSTF